MQIGRVRFARVERNNDALVTEIDLHVADAVDPLERGTQFSDAFVAIFAFSRDLDRFENVVIGTLGTKWVAWVGIVRSGWVHKLSYVARGHAGRLARDWFKRAPDILRQNFLAGRVGMNAIGEIQ